MVYIILEGFPLQSSTHESVYAQVNKQLVHCTVQFNVNYCNQFRNKADANPHLKTFGPKNMPTFPYPIMQSWALENTVATFGHCFKLHYR